MESQQMVSSSKWQQKEITANGSPRAAVPFTKLKTLWFNTGTICNLTCSNCYIESSPINDSLVFLTLKDVLPYSKEIADNHWELDCIGLTGGEPFVNPEIFQIVEFLLSKGFHLLILTNALMFTQNKLEKLDKLNKQYPGLLQLRISLDHYDKEVHEEQRGKDTFHKSLENMKRLHLLKIALSLAGRSLVNENPESAKKGYQDLLNSYEISLELTDKTLTIFPEMGLQEDVPEITTSCYKKLNISPANLMCSTERMIVRRKDSLQASVLACTLIAYDKQFELSTTIKDSFSKVYLNHKFCANFCVLGGANCSG